MTEFKRVSTITACIALTLCMVLITYPEAIFLLFGIPENSSAFFIGRRAAMLFLGISVFAWVGRNAVHSESRQAICLGLAISMLALAILGTLEYLRGYAGIGIFLAVVAEAVLSALYFKIWLSCRNVEPDQARGNPLV